MFELRQALTLVAAGMVAASLLAQLAAAGEPPYEMAGRVPSHPPLVDFEDLAGWTVTVSPGAEASFQPSTEQRIWGDHVGKLTYRGAQDDSVVEIRPPQPIPIPEPWDCCYMWIYGDNWGWVAAPNRPRVTIMIEDAAGERRDVELSRVDYNYWFLSHRRAMPRHETGALAGHRAGAAPGASAPQAARFVGLRVRDIKREEPSAIYFDNLTFYTEVLGPLTFEPRAALPFPTTANTILPPVGEPCQHRAGREGDAYVFESAGASATVTYTYAPRRGTLEDIHARAAGRTFAPLAEGGPRFEVEGVVMSPADGAVRRTLRRLEFRDGRLRADWRWEKEGRAADWTLALALHGRSLTVDIAAPDEHATELDLGRVAGLSAPQAVHVPYLSNNGNGPKVIAGDGVFLSAVFDWYVTEASEFRGFGQAEASPRHYAGRLRYHPKTDGARNPLRERIVVTVSPFLAEVLPAIPNPRSDMMETATPYLWRQMGFVSLDALRRFKAYGIDDLIPMHHEIIWRDGGESFTLRLESAPTNVGDEQLKDYMRQVRALGYRPGLYTNYRDFAPVNRNWDPDWVTRLPDGNWQLAWPRNYVLKAMRAAEAEAYFAPRIHAKFGTAASYCDVHTATAPWESTDYDARVPGAGKMRTVFEEYGRLLFNESTAHAAPTFSEGRNHFWWAGLVDGNYGQMLTDGPAARHPWLVDFDLLRLHPLETDFGMGDPGMYFGDMPWTKELHSHSPYFDRFMAATIAFGHIGYLAAEWGIEGAVKSYYLIHDLQQHYVGVLPEAIEYNSPRGLVSTDEAVMSGAYRDSQVHVRYPGGLEIWANGSWDNEWTVRADGREWVLPPAGFMARKPGAVSIYSGLVEGKRVDRVETAASVYVDTRGELTRLGPVMGAGAVVVRPADGGIEVIPATRCDDLALHEAEADSPAAFLRGWQARVAGVAGVSETGEEIGAAEWALSGGALRITPLPGAIKYRLRLRP